MKKVKVDWPRRYEKDGMLIEAEILEKIIKAAKLSQKEFEENAANYFRLSESDQYFIRTIFYYGVSEALKEVLNLYPCDLYGDGSDISDGCEHFDMPRPPSFK